MNNMCKKPGSCCRCEWPGYRLDGVGYVVRHAAEVGIVSFIQNFYTESGKPEVSNSVGTGIV